MPWDPALTRRFRWLAIAQCVAEDLPQLAIVVLVTENLLGGWTPLNALSVAATVCTLLASVAINVVGLRATNQPKLQRTGCGEGVELEAANPVTN